MTLLWWPARASAHPAHALPVSWSPSGWLSALRDGDVGVVIAVGLLTVAYAVGVRALWRVAGNGHGIQQWRAWSFSLGITALALALLSPLEPMSDALLSAHMVQHMLLIAVAPPLIALGRPGIAAAWMLPATMRRRVAAWYAATPRARGWLERSRRTATLPALVWALHAGALWMWHTPRLYGAALGAVGLHALEHLCFFGSAILVWWTVISPSGSQRVGHGAGILVLLATAIQSGALGALLAFSRAAWYPEHAAGSAAYALSPLEDQQIAGLVMWVPGGVIYLVAAALLFLRWLDVGSRGPSRTIKGSPALQSVGGVS